MHHLSYITCVTEKQVRRQGWRNCHKTNPAGCTSHSAVRPYVHKRIYVCSFLTKATFISCLNQSFSTSLNGNPTLCAICSRCHISLLKINIAAVERHQQGGRERGRDGELLKMCSFCDLWRRRQPLRSERIRELCIFASNVTVLCWYCCTQLSCIGSILLPTSTWHLTTYICMLSRQRTGC